MYSFEVEELPGFKHFCEPKTIHYKKLERPVLNIMTFYSKVDDTNIVDFNEEQ